MAHKVKIINSTKPHEVAKKLNGIIERNAILNTSFWSCALDGEIMTFCAVEFQPK